MANDYTALLAAIDAGDDLALLALADLMEGHDDPRAAELRAIAIPRYEPYSYWPAGTIIGGVATIRPSLASEHPGEKSPWKSWAWWTDLDGCHEHRDSASGVRADVYRRLPGGVETTHHRGRRRVYPTRSAAFLALAEALSPE